MCCVRCLHCTVNRWRWGCVGWCLVVMESLDVTNKPINYWYFTLSLYLEDESDDQKLTKRDLHTLNEQRRRDLIKVAYVTTTQASYITVSSPYLIFPLARICSAYGSGSYVSSHFFRKQAQPSYHLTKKSAYLSPFLCFTHPHTYFVPLCFPVLTPAAPPLISHRIHPVLAQSSQ